jgi:hypothetical protein
MSNLRFGMVAKTRWSLGKTPSTCDPAMSSDTYTYDADGNRVTRSVGGISYTLSYDAENRRRTRQVARLVGVSRTKIVQVAGAVTATFVYDGDGNRVKATVSGTTTTYLGNYFERTGSTLTTISDRTRYYFEGGTKVAMRTGASTLNYLWGDHSLVSRDRLGSNAITTSSRGVKNSEIRYMPWRTTRYTSGTNP